MLFRSVEAAAPLPEFVVCVCSVVCVRCGLCVCGVCGVCGVGGVCVVCVCVWKWKEGGIEPSITAAPIIFRVSAPLLCWRRDELQLSDSS